MRSAASIGACPRRSESRASAVAVRPQHVRRRGLHRPGGRRRVRGIRRAVDRRSPPRPTRRSRPTGAWRTLPPIQRSSGPPPVVAPAAPFLAEVPGHAPLPPIVTPLGHDSSPSAPAGMVVVHPHPVPSLTSHAPLPTRPVQRQAAPGGAPSMTSVSAADVASPAGDRPAARRPARPSGLRARRGRSGGAGAAPDPDPCRRSPRPRRSRPPARPLTQAAPALAPLASAVRPRRGVGRGPGALVGARGALAAAPGERQDPVGGALAASSASSPPRPRCPSGASRSSRPRRRRPPSSATPALVAAPGSVPR